MCVFVFVSYTIFGFAAIPFFLFFFSSPPCPSLARVSLVCLFARQAIVFNDISYSELVRVEVRGMRKLGENPVLGTLEFEVGCGWVERGSIGAGCSLLF